MFTDNAPSKLPTFPRPPLAEALGIKVSGEKMAIDDAINYKNALYRESKIFPTFPQSLQDDINNWLTVWSGALRQNHSHATPFDKTKMIAVISQRLEKANKSVNLDQDLDEEDLDTLSLLKSRPPKRFPIISSFSPSELYEKVPYAKRMNEHLPANSVWSIFLQDSGFFYIIQTPNGQLRKFKIVKTNRNLSAIKNDISNRPACIPPMEVFQLDNGLVGLTVDWVIGSSPTNEQQATLCKNAANSLESVPMEEINGNHSIWFDLNRTNFIVKDRQAFYTDFDIPEVIVTHGLSPGKIIDRRLRLEDNKQRLNS